jgi:hypothetical protein
MLLALDDGSTTLLAAAIAGMFTVLAGWFGARRDIGRREKVERDEERNQVPTDQVPTDSTWHHLIDQDIGGIKAEVRANTDVISRVVDYLHHLGWESADDE